MLTKYDRALIYCLLAFALFSLLGTAFVAHSLGKPTEAVVSVNGQNTAHFTLQRESRISVRGMLGESKIEIAEGKVRIVSSPCLQKVCVHQGWISKPGDAVICAPNQVVVKIVGEHQSKSVDAVSQ